MDFFRSRAGALALTVVAVLGSLLLNTRVKLGNACQKTEDAFYTSETSVKSIYARLDQRADAANGLWSILQKYDADAASRLSLARNVLVDARAARDISAMYDANEALQTAFDTALAALNAQTLSAGDQSAVSDYETAFSGAQKMIDENGYNELTRAFLQKTYDVFPARLLASLTGVDAPELFES